MLSTWRLQQQWQLDLLWATLHKQKHRRRRRRLYKRCDGVSRATIDPRQARQQRARAMCPTTHACPALSFFERSNMGVQI